ncbi:beta-N-acetyl-D-glucosaminide beta-1,4-N-acetylglucosaminyl-transferase-like [Physella acuta]|uniref:beta-N-acetyl-D-glucosaminide beta-1,4-N-acetylglucosaminyl-transferase-like n=1 Tax=Physella acuta TaxID=109671 RepID=UPI0027DB8935|nr:beta-N-acetyl-D-glucosaminide beta-1,4-N-acetylglucosaminyl-transferase-like [Physella acuta]
MRFLHYFRRIINLLITALFSAKIVCVTLQRLAPLVYVTTRTLPSHLASSGRRCWTSKMARSTRRCLAAWPRTTCRKLSSLVPRLPVTSCLGEVKRSPMVFAVRVSVVVLLYVAFRSTLLHQDLLLQKVHDGWRWLRWNGLTPESYTCPQVPEFLMKRFNLPTSTFALRELIAMYPHMLSGGHFVPNCVPRRETAILIPFRNRCPHLNQLLPVLIPMLMRQNIDFTLFIIEQVSDGKFNKGLMYNAGYLEALKLDTYGCFILHDVDMIPLDDRNLYRCLQAGPVHFSPSISKYGFRNLYGSIFGGVVAFTRRHFRQVNGFSNIYFGWGAEDDDLRERAVKKNLPLHRKNTTVGVYHMPSHGVDKGWEVNSARRLSLGMTKARQHLDGLNSAIYNVTKVTKFHLFTWISVSFSEEKVLATVPDYLQRGEKEAYTQEQSPFIVVD